MSYDDLEGSSQEHRRLRFSFHINNVKDPEPPQRPDRLAPCRRRRRRFREPRTPCQPLFSEISQTEERTLQTAKNRRRKPRGLPLHQTGDSIEARKLRKPTRKSKRFFSLPLSPKPRKPQSPKPKRPARSRARQPYTGAPPIQQAVSDGHGNFFERRRFASDETAHGVLNAPCWIP